MDIWLVLEVSKSMFGQIMLSINLEVYLARLYQWVPILFLEFSLKWVE